MPFPPNSYVAALTSAPPNVTVFGERVFKEVIKVKWGHVGGPYADVTDDLIRNGDNMETVETYVHTPRGDLWGRSEKTAIYKPRREAGEETKPTNTVTLEQKKIVMNSSSVCLYVIMV